MTDEIKIAGGGLASIAMPSMTFTLKAPTKHCPACGTDDSTFIDGIPRITVTIAPYEGEYCQICYAKWLSENIPKLVAGASHGHPK